MRSSEWLSLRRCLAIVQRLLMGPASPSEILDYVIKLIGDDCYAVSSSRKEKAFKHDRESIRQRLRVDFYYDPSTNKYILLDPGPFFSVNLSQSNTTALALLSETFGGQIGEHSEIQGLIDQLIARLPLEKRRQIENPHLPINIELFQDVDPSGISESVWNTLWRAVKEHRKIRFNYISPRYTDGRKVLHEVAPYRIQYQQGHWYLRAYRDYRKDADGQIDRQGAHLRYRLSYIQTDDQLEILPTLFGSLPKLPKYLVHYRLLHPLSQGAISSHFDDMTIKRLDDGSIEVIGYTNDAWEAGRVLLSYGEFCIVLGGDEVRAWILRTVGGMVNNYSTDL
jgi:hypothetical protein